jgi:hypothetical protein
MMMLINPRMTHPTKYVFKAGIETIEQLIHPSTTPEASVPEAFGHKRKATKKRIHAFISIENIIFIRASLNE